jgi:hypothetical protein
MKANPRTGREWYTELAGRGNRRMEVAARERFRYAWHATPVEGARWQVDFLIDAADPGAQRPLPESMEVEGGG